MSFTKASEELNVTRVAVSQQIKSMEDFLGTKLFHRLHRSLRLTRAGESYHRAISASLQSILAATVEVKRGTDGNRVTVTTSTGFATYWLLPRIGEFSRQHPEIDIQLLVADSYLDFSAQDIDVAIRYGNGDWPNLTAKFLLQEEIYPICSKSYLDGRPPLTDPQQLLNERLLHLEGNYDPETRWDVWFRDHNVQILSQPPGLRLNTYSTLVQATLDGQGIALVGPPLMQSHLDSGALVRPIEVDPTLRRAFYLALPAACETSLQTEVFYAWLEQQV